MSKACVCGSLILLKDMFDHIKICSTVLQKKHDFKKENDNKQKNKKNKINILPFVVGSLDEKVISPVFLERKVIELYQYLYDQKIPFKNPNYIFEYFSRLNKAPLCLLDKYKIYINNIVKSGGFQSFEDSFNTLLKKLLSFFCEEKKSILDKFINMEIKEEKLVYPRGNAYNQKFIGKKILSIDLKQASYQIISGFFPELFNNLPNWEAFIATFTDNNFFITNKNIRHIVFGKIPNLSNKIEALLKNLHVKILSDIKESKLVDESLFENCVVDSDEIIFVVDEKFNKDQLIKFFEINYPNKYHIDMFTLSCLGKNDKACYVKKYLDDQTIEFKRCQMKYACQYVKKYYNLPFDTFDLSYEENGVIKTNSNPLDFS